jgi:hypothetical protein
VGEIEGRKIVDFDEDFFWSEKEMHKDVET